MLSLELRIDRAERWLRMIEQDARRLDLRVAALSRQSQEAARSFAQSLAAQTRAELKRLREEETLLEGVQASPQAAD